MSPKQNAETTTPTGIEEEIEVLDQDAREALDKLADKREELQRQLKATELAEGKERERQEERRRREREEAERKAEEEAQARREKIAREMGELEAEREELANRLVEVLERRQELTWETIQDVNRHDQDRANEMVLGHMNGVQNWIKERFGV